MEKGRKPSRDLAEGQSGTRKANALQQEQVGWLARSVFDSGNGVCSWNPVAEAEEKEPGWTRGQASGGKGP